MTDYLKKHLLFIVLFCIILFALLFILLFNKSNNDIISNDNNIVNNTNNGMFAIMLETEAGSGEYQESKSNTWPGEGYIFNENLSVCENGSELTWNEELGAVNLKTNIADRCFVYFDIYILPEILEVTVSDITSNSITLTVNAVAGTNAIKTYYYSIDNGSSWVSSASNSYTFTNLTMNTLYNISVYVTDSNEEKSSKYNIDVTTDIELITFTVTDTYDNNTAIYYAREGMTWNEWVNSEFNNSDVITIYISCNVVYFNGHMDPSLSKDDIIIANNKYSFYGFGPPDVAC